MANRIQLEWDYSVDYYLPPKSIRLTERQRNYLKALDPDPQYRKYQHEYKVHCWMPPLTTAFPRDYSIVQYD